MADVTNLAHPEIQASLIAEALLSASVGFLVWDEDRRYIAANDAACRILGCTRERLLGSPVGGQTVAGDEAVAEALTGQNGYGTARVRRFDGTGELEIFYATFTARSAGMPWMATVIWPRGELRELELRKEAAEPASPDA